MKLIRDTSSPALASVTGGMILAVITVLQCWGSVRPYFSSTTTVRTSCKDQERPLPHVYLLNPRYGTPFAGESESKENSNCHRGQRKLLSLNPQAQNHFLNRDFVRFQIPKFSLSKNKSKPHNTIPLYGHVFPDGLYYISVGVGNPAKTYFLDIDTGSHLTWLTCDAPCVNCPKSPNSWYDPSHASLVSCESATCQSLRQDTAVQSTSGCPPSEPATSQCDYELYYGDGSASQGVLVTDVLSFLHPAGKLIKSKVVFGCAYEHFGPLAHSPAKSDGLLGLGPGEGSIPNQLAKSGVISNVFAHCISSHPSHPSSSSSSSSSSPSSSSHHGYFFFGFDLVPYWITWVPMLEHPNPDMKHYYVGLHGLKLGDTWLNVHESVFQISDLGGTIFDSGSSFTYLSSFAHRTLLLSINFRLVGSPLSHVKTEDGFFCWKFEKKEKIRSVDDVSSWFDDLALEFDSKGIFGIQNTLKIAPQNYLFINSHGHVCLGILDSKKISNGDMNVIGDVSLRGLLVVYDNVHKRIGWVERNCDEIP